MVSKGRIHKELGKFLKIYWNFKKEDSMTNPWNKKSLNLDLISQRNH